MKSPQSQLLTVTATSTVSPNMQRLTLTGESLSSYPYDCEGGYIKFLFNQFGTTDLSSLKEGERPTMRTYTIRRYNQAAQSIEVDFVRHITQDQQCGYASRWAMNAEVGDTVNIAGPGIIQSMNLEADWFFLVADMTALPALTAKIQSLPDEATGYAVIKVISKDDIQPINAPANVQLTWLVDDQHLADTVQSLAWKTGAVSVWCACEFDSMRQLRQYFRNDKEVAKENIYISSYWKQGVTEDGHKVIKRQDAESQADA